MTVKKTRRSDQIAVSHRLGIVINEKKKKKIVVCRCSNVCTLGK